MNQETTTMREPTEEAIREALESSDTFYEDNVTCFILMGLRNWITNGHFAVRVSDPSKFGAKEREKDRTSPPIISNPEWLDGHARKGREFPVVTELTEHYLPSVVGNDEVREGDLKCNVCDGRGDHRCSCGDFHNCDVCEGSGVIKGKIIKPEVKESLGRFIVTDGKDYLVMQGRFRGLFQGLTMRAQCAEDGRLCANQQYSPLYGFDDNNLVVMAMPMNFNMKTDIENR